MKRNEMREQAFLLTFESLFNSNESADELINVFNENISELSDYAKQIFIGINDKKNEFDDVINKFSKDWKASRIPKVSLAIFYIALYEMNYVDSLPESVAINEAVNLAKKYAYPEDASFINGVLGAYSRSK